RRAASIGNASRAAESPLTSTSAPRSTSQLKSRVLPSTACAVTRRTHSSFRWSSAPWKTYTGSKPPVSRAVLSDLKLAAAIGGQYSGLTRPFERQARAQHAAELTRDGQGRDVARLDQAHAQQGVVATAACTAVGVGPH